MTTLDTTFTTAARGFCGWAATGVVSAFGGPEICAANMGDTIVGDMEARARGSANTAAVPACGMLVEGLENDWTVAADFAVVGFAGESVGLLLDDLDGDTGGATS